MIAGSPAKSAGLVFVDGKLSRTLAPGRLRLLEFPEHGPRKMIEFASGLYVSGQELLTEDKVSLRVNLAASMRVTDPVAARTRWPSSATTCTANCSTACVRRFPRR